MTALFVAAGILEARSVSSLAAKGSSDVWWHLRTGLWILQNHTLPHAGLFSQMAERPWRAVSWIYDVKLAVFYRLLGLRAIPIFAVGFKAALAVVTFLLARGHRGNFWAAVMVSAVAQYVLGGMAPAPVYGSVLFFGIELVILLESRRGRCPSGAKAPSTLSARNGAAKAASLQSEAQQGPLGGSQQLSLRYSRPKVLLWLVPLFLVWANVDAQFVYGLGSLILFLLARVVEEWWGEPAKAGSRAKESGAGGAAIGRLTAITGACFVATLVTPYFYGPYEVFLAKAFSAANVYLPDTYAPGFRQPQDYVLVLFVMAAFLAVGLRRSTDIFLIALLAITTALAFHSRQDIWVVVLAVPAVMGEMFDGVELRDEAGKRRRALDRSEFGMTEFWIAAGSAAVILVAAVAVVMPRGEGKLLAKAGENYPVEACNYIRENRLPQPIFNSLEWGGFLTWYLPEYPVAIDGRIDVYGDDFIVEYSRMMNADVRYTQFAPIANAQTIVLPRTAIMAQALGSLPAYKVVYSDDVAIVLRRVI